VCGTVPRSRVSLNRGIHVELRMTKGKKKLKEKLYTAAGDSFQTGQTAKALQGYRVQSLPRRTPAAVVVVMASILAIASHLTSSKDLRTEDFI